MKINKPINVNQPLLNGNEKKYLNECIDSGWISSEGPFVQKFEELFAKQVMRKHAISVSNGTAAIDVAIEALQISKDDEVIVPAFTIISCINQIIRVGAKPVLVDSDLKTWNMDVSQIESKITSKTKAILMVHIYGLPVDVDPILAIAKKYNLKVIEDAAEMHGQFYKGKPCGSFGDMSIFSFYANKLITTGEGGMVLTNDDKLAEDFRSLRNLCFQSDNRFVHQRLGWNLRMTNLQAAVGLAQLERLDEFVVIKRRMGETYNKLLGNIEGIQLPLQKTNYSENIYWIYGILIDKKMKTSAKEVMNYLKENGIGTRPFFYPIHQQPVLKKMGLFKNDSHPNSELMYEQGFYIPSGLGLTQEEIEITSNILNLYFKH